MQSEVTAQDRQIKGFETLCMVLESPIWLRPARRTPLFLALFVPVMSLSPAPLAILSNHLSTQNQKDGDWLDDMGLDDTWVHRLAFDRIEDIPALLSQCASAGVETIAVDGGDGTAGLIFSGLLNEGVFGNLPALALLPSGKTNMTAEAWSLRGDRRVALDELLRRHQNGEIGQSVYDQPIVTLQEGTATPPRHGAFFGGADVVDGILYCRRAIYPLGLPNAVSHTAAVSVLFWRAVFSGNKGGVVSTRFDDSTVGEDGHFFVVLVTTMDRMLLGMQPAPQEGEGPLHYLSLRPGPWPILATLPSLLRRRIVASSARTVRRTKSVTVTSGGQYTLDGELHKTSPDTPLQLSGHQSLMFVRW